MESRLEKTSKIDREFTILRINQNGLSEQIIILHSYASTHIAISFFLS